MTALVHAPLCHIIIGTFNFVGINNLWVFISFDLTAQGHAYNVGVTTKVMMIIMILYAYTSSTKRSVMAVLMPSTSYKVYTFISALWHR
jgi:hypothetical protein